MRTRLAAGALCAVAIALLGAAGCSSQAASTSSGATSAGTTSASVPQVASASHPCGLQAEPAAYRHVIWIWMENHSSGTIVGSSQAPYLSALARECGLATNYHNITHPSLPNYVAATSGLSYSALQGFLPDCDPGAGCDTSAPSIFGQGETWKAYEESMPSDCDPSDSGDYAVRHNPPVYYTTLHSCSSDDVPYSRLATDLARDRLPAFSFITPNLIDDMHDGTVADGDTWLSRNLPAILGSAEYRNGSTVVFITWDEGEDGGYASGEPCATNTTDVSCHVATLVISPSTKAGTRSGTLFNHYSLLATAEQLLGLPKLGLAAAYPPMTKAFDL
ncbi:MAG TPA: alkaline phosphatase family protein [Streptosporangiaceae bacterium]